MEFRKLVMITLYARQQKRHRCWQFDLWFCSSAFSKSSLNMWKFTVRVLLKLGLENFEHYFASVWDECNCTVVWAFFGISFFWDWNENWPFPVLWLLLSFPNLLIMVKGSDKTWSTGERNGKPLQYSSLENLTNSMKRQKDRTLKDELPGLVGAQYATGDQWRNNSRKNEETETKQNTTQLWIWLVTEARSDAVKSNTA